MTLQKRVVGTPANVTVGGTIAVPSNTSIASGDFMLAWFSCPSGTPRLNSTIDGWHQLGPARAYDSVYLYTFYRISAGSEPTTYATDFTQAMSGCIFVVNSDSSSHIQIDDVSHSINAASTSITYPSVTFSASGMLLNFGCMDGIQSNTTASTEEVDGPTLTTGRLYLMREAVSSGSTGTRTSTASSSVSSETVSIALIDAPFTNPVGPVFRSSIVKGQQNSVTSLTINAPTNIKSGDLLLLDMSFQTSSVTHAVSQGGGSNTWTLLDEVTGSNSVHVWYKYATAGDIGSSYTVSWTGSKTVDCGIISYYCPSNNSINIDAHNNQTNTAQSNLPCQTITTTKNKSIVVWFVTNSTTGGATWDTSAPYGQPLINTGTNFKVRSFDEYVPNSGSTGTRLPTIGGTSNDSKVVAVALSEITLPNDPTTLTATKNGTNQIDLTWSDTSSNETGFEVERSSNGTTGWSLIATTAADTTSYSDTGLSENATWYYRVRAINLSGNSGYTNVATATTDIGVPTGLTATTISTTQIDLSWTDNSSIETGYEVERSLNGTTGWTSITTTAPNTTSYSVTGLTVETLYYFRIREVYSGGSTAYTSTVNTYTGPNTPTNLLISPSSSTEVIITWTDNSSIETLQSIEKSLNGTTGWSEVATPAANTALYILSTGLSEGTTYYFRMRAKYGTVYSDYSAIANGTTYVATPTGLTVTPNSTTQITLEWTDNSSHETAYEVSRSLNGTTGWVIINTPVPNTVTYVDTLLTGDTRYYYRVRADMSGVYSDYVTGNNYTLPFPVTVTVTNRLSTKQRVSWVNINTHVDNYVVQKYNGSSFVTIDSPIGTFTDVTGLTESTTYIYRVRVQRDTYFSDWSTEISKTTLATLVAPIGLSATMSGKYVRIAWVDPNIQSTGYLLERSTNGIDFAEITDVAVNHFVDEGVTQGNTYYWRARAYRSGSVEYGPYSPTVSFTVHITPTQVEPSYLFLLNPNTLLQARVTGTITYPVTSIVYTVDDGDETTVRAGMTICFGTASGLHDLGRQRIRSINTTTNTIYIGRSSQGTHDGEVDIVAGSYITIFDEYRVWSKTPFIDTDGTVYKDSDIAISDNTIYTPPVSNCGPGMAGLWNGALYGMRVQFDSTSYATNGTITSYLWDFADGTVIGGSTTDAGTITVQFPPGFRWIHLTVTDSNGKSHTSHAPIFARVEGDSTIRNFEITNHSIKPEGQSLSLMIRQDISAYPDGMLVMLWSGTPTENADRTPMKFIGWHNQDPIVISSDRSGTVTDVTLECVDILGRLALLPGYSQLIEADDTPADWQHMKEPNTDLYLHYLLHWHSTALDLADFTPSLTGASYSFQVMGSDGSSLYDQVNARCVTFVPDYVLTCNRLGQIRVLPDPMIHSTRTSTEQVTLHPQDYTRISYTNNHVPRIRRIHGGAIKSGYYATDVQIDTYFCYAPGITPGQGLEDQEHNEGLAISQADLNDAIGNRYARLNSKYSKFNITLAYGDDRGINPSDMTWVRVIVFDTKRGTSFEARGLPLELDIKYNYARTGTTLDVDLTWELETVGKPAITDIPVAIA